MNRVRSFNVALATASVVALCAPAAALAQSASLAPGTAGLPFPVVAGPPCFATPFSPDGDIYSAGVTIPMGPAGCGLGFPVAGNVDAFSTGLSPAVGIALPLPAGAYAVNFSVDPTATGDTLSSCTAATPGAFPLATDVGAEACGMPASSDAAADVFITAPYGAPMGGGGPVPGASPHFQVADGDGVVNGFCPLPVGFPIGLAEPSPPSADDVDAIDGVPAAAYDVAPMDSTPDAGTPVYFSVDAATAALAAVGAADVLVTAGGVFGLYAAPAALGLGAADDIDALVVLDTAFDGVYAPGAGDIVIYSVAPGSAAIGAADCFGVAIEEGDLLTEGTPLGFPGVPCGVAYEEDMGLWAARACGANPITGLGGDNLNAADIVLPAGLPTTTTSTTTTTLPPPLCGGAPLGGCKTALSGKSQLQIKLKASDPSRNQLKFKYNKGAATFDTEFGDPVGGSPQYSLCVWDSSVDPQPLLEAQILPGGTCGTKPCWKATPGKRLQYKNKGGNADGVEQVKIKADGSPDKTQIQVKAKGASFAAPTLPLTTTVTAQFLVDDGGITCWEVPMSTPTKNDAAQFKAKGD